MRGVWSQPSVKESLGAREPGSRGAGQARYPAGLQANPSRD